MSYILASTTIKAPLEMIEENSTQNAQNRTLSGAINRDYFGSNKRVWILKYRNSKKSDFDTINTIYQAYLSTNTAQTWSVTETNYTVGATTVHVDLTVRSFVVGGSSYLSDYDLILTEA